MLAAQVPKCVRRAGARTFFASQTTSLPQVALDEEFPTLPRTTPQAPAPPSLTATTTPSGLKLASDNRDGLVATLGIEIAAGARDETDDSAGLAQLAAKMAFRATAARSDLRLFRDIEAIGGKIYKAAGRDFVRYNISVLPDKLEAAAAILAETTLAPRLAHWDIAIQKKQVELEANAIASCARRSAYEGIHAAAFYDDVTLGRSVATAENLAALDEAALAGFYDKYVNTSGLVLVGAGVTHHTLTDIANEFFAGLPSASAPLHKAPAKYVGGESRVKKSNACKTFVTLGFETVGKKSPEYGASKVLKALLTARLQNKKLGGFLASYEDVGIVGLSGAAAPADAGALVDKFVTEIKKLAAAEPSADELAQAKTTVALEATSALATRQGELALLGTVAFAQSPAKSPVALVEGVTAKAVQELAQKALASRPSLASVGKLTTVPRLDAVVAKLK